MRVPFQTPVLLASFSSLDPPIGNNVHSFAGDGRRTRAKVINVSPSTPIRNSFPSLFSQFDSVNKLSLKCDRRSASINDDGLILISLSCQNLTCLKLRSCRQLTDLGMVSFAKNCKGSKWLSCGSCTFGAKGMNALVDNCPYLEELSMKRLRGISNGKAAEPIGPGSAALSLKFIYLKDLYNT